jgi:hypothetical protein
MVEITGHRGALLDRKTIRLSNGAQRVVLPVDETYRGNVGLTVFFVKHNYIYTRHEIINVPYKNKELQWSFASFRDKLQPGQQEEWRITIKDRNGDAVAAELLASMYDVSLDAFAGHKWQFFPWRTNAGLSVWNTGASFRTGSSNELWFNYPHKTEIVQREYDRLIFLHWFAPPQFRSAAKLSLNAPQENSVGIFYAESGIAKRTGKSADAMVDVADNIGTLLFSDSEIVNGIPTPPAPALPSIQIRTNLQETAFFYPQLSTNEKGETVIRFTVPDALTRWNMQGLAWTTDLKTAYIQKSLITQKELMIFSNPPRFFREGDTLSFTAKISNLSARPLTVTTHLLFFDALTSKPLALIIDKGESSRIATVDAGGNHVQTWRIAIPEGIQAIGYRIMATANVPDVAETTRAVSDGEEQIIPALTDRMLITESLPMFVRGKQHREFTFAKLSGNRSATLRSQAFTVEFTSYPVWNAVLSLPYIMNYSYNCVEQTFSRYYANAVAAHIVRSYPRIKQTFDIWRNYQPSALSSALEKNSELKSILLEETPWVSDARNESESRQQIAALFDNNRINSEQATTWQKLQQAQSPNGGFAWFTGGRDDRYITQHIVSGIGRLYRMHIAIEEATGMLDKAIGYMDTQIAEDYERIRRQSDKAKSDAQKENHLHALTVHYLYARSFFIDTYPIRANALDAFNYFLSQAAGYWTTLDNNYLKGMLALALHRYNDTRTAKSIIRSLDETAIHDKEAGMYWRNEQRGRQWYQSPVEMYALMVEAFDEIDYNRSRIEELQTTLLRHKQTHHWKTTKATADAIYALLLPSSEQLSVEGAAKSPGLSPLLVSNAADRLPVITVGSDTVAETPVEAGTGYFKTAWYGSDIHLNMGRIAVDNPNAGIIWGAAYWQYLEQLKHITSASTGVGIRKQLFVKTNTSSGVILKQITPDAPIKVGDRITVRLEVSIDSDMEYVHLKDMRAAAFEPVNVLSGYRYQGGIGYYESIRDAASHFFIDHLPKGLYIFEYDLNATQEGVFSNGITTLQCMYAPEFSAHTEGIRVEVKNK